MSGKGDTYRPVDHKKFAENYDIIFKKESLCDNCVESCYVIGKVITNCRDYNPRLDILNQDTPQSSGNRANLNEQLLENVSKKAEIENLSLSASWKSRVYHPPIKDEISVEWKAISKVVKARDKNKCQSCGIKLGLSVHHIIPREEGGRDYPPNLITLCKFCHDEIEELGFRNRLQIIDFKNKRKYIKHDNQHTMDNPICWQQWVYGGYKRPT